MSGKLNIELFKKVRDRIAAIPESYNQSAWVMDAPESPCGAAACLAGEAIICNAQTPEEGIKELKNLMRSDDDCAVPQRASELLGLEGDYSKQHEGEAAIFLSDARGWPSPYRELFTEAPTLNEESQVAVAFLDHIIETGKVLE